MSSQQELHLNRLHTTLSYLDTNRQIWESVPIVVTYRNHLADAISGLQTEQSDPSDDTEFSGSTLQQLRITIAEKMDILDDILEAYAADIADKKLLEEAENSKSDYLRLTNDGFERKVTTVIRLLEQHQDELGAYGLVKEQMLDVHQDFDKYKSKRTNPDLASKANHTHSPQYQLLLDEGLGICDRLENVIVSFRTSNTAFYNGFRSINDVST